jgi:hypothetical protein
MLWEIWFSLEEVAATNQLGNALNAQPVHTDENQYTDEMSIHEYTDDYHHHRREEHELHQVIERLKKANTGYLLGHDLTALLCDQEQIVEHMLGSSGELGTELRILRQG